MAFKRPLDNPQNNQATKKSNFISISSPSRSPNLTINSQDESYFDDDLDDLLSQMPVSQDQGGGIFVRPQSTQLESRNDEENRVRGELVMTKDRLDIVHKKFEFYKKEQEERAQEKDLEIKKLKDDKEKLEQSLLAKLSFKDAEIARMKVRVSELESNLLKLKSVLEEKRPHQSLPNSLPILMHRLLDLSPDGGFVDFDDSVSIDDFDD